MMIIIICKIKHLELLLHYFAIRRLFKVTAVDRKETIYAIIGIILMFSGWFIPPIEPITEVGMQLVGIFVGLIWLWSTSGMLWPSLMGIAAMMFSDYGNFATVLAASFGNFSVWSTAFMMAIFGVIEQYGVNDYIVRWILSRKIINGRPWIFTFIWFFTVFVLSALGAGFAMIFMFWGLTYKLAEDLGYQKKDKYITMLLYGVVISSAIANPALPFMPWILQINGIWSGLSGNSAFTYAQHLIMVLPISICTLIAYILLMRFVFKADIERLKSINTEMFTANPLPPMDKIQKLLLWYIPIVVVVLFAPSVMPATWKITQMLNSAGAAGLSIFFFAVLCLIRKDGKSIIDMHYLGGEKIAWDLVFLLACVMAISSALTADSTGVKPFLSGILNPIFGGMSPFILFAVLLFVCLFLTNLANNGVIALLLLSIFCITTADMNLPNTGYFVTMLAYACQVAFLIPGSSIYGALLHGNENLSASFIYKMTICVFIATFLIFLAFWPVSLLVY